MDWVGCVLLCQYSCVTKKKPLRKKGGTNGALKKKAKKIDACKSRAQQSTTKCTKYTVVVAHPRSSRAACAEDSPHSVTRGVSIDSSGGRKNSFIHPASAGSNARLVDKQQRNPCSFAPRFLSVLITHHSSKTFYKGDEARSTKRCKRQLSLGDNFTSPLPSFRSSMQNKNGFKSPLDKRITKPCIPLRLRTYTMAMLSEVRVEPYNQVGRGHPTFAAMIKYVSYRVKKLSRSSKHAKNIE